MTSNNACPTLQTESDSDDEDNVHIFVSPKHLVGRTPGPHAGVQNVFGLPFNSYNIENTSPYSKSSDDAIDFENPKEKKESGKSISIFLIS